MQCPKCSYARQESDNLAPDGQCPRCGIVYAKYKKAAEKTVSLCLVSGQIVEFREIKLYDSRAVKQLSDLQASIEKNLRGFKTGIGFIGDVEDVVAGSVVTGVVDGIVSGSMAATAQKQVQEAKDLYRKIRDNPYTVPVSLVENIDLPQPELWRVPAFKSNAKIELIQLSSRFLIVVNDGKDMSVFWDKVQSYSLIE